MKRKQNGFTLIELFVVLGLTALLVGVGLANYRRLNERKIIEGAAKTVEQALWDAQKRATSGVKPSGWCAGSPYTLVSYEMSVRNSTWGHSMRGYGIRANCSDGSYLTVVNAQLPNEAVFPSTQTVAFTVITDGVASDTTFEVQNTAGTIRYQIRVTVGGAVTFEKIS